MARILFLMQWFNPEPQIKGLAFAKTISSLGFDIEVLTGFPNYPGGALYPGHTLKLLKIEQLEGVRVLRTLLYPYHGGSSIKRILNYVSFGLSSLISGLIAAKRPHLIYSCGPPVTVGVSAAVLGLILRRPFVYDIQDLWPETLASSGMLNNRTALKIVDLICSWVYERAAHITVQSPGIRKILMKKGVPEEKISLVFNWCDESALSPAVGTSPTLAPRDGTNKTFDVLFAGTMGKLQCLDSVLEAAEILSSEAPTVRFLFMGGGIEVDRLQNLVKSRGIGNVAFLPRVSMAESGFALAQASALLVHLRNDPLFKFTIPAKTQAYMAAGRPILMAVDGDATELVCAAKAGVYATPEDARSIANAVLELLAMGPAKLDELGENGRRYYEENLAFDVGARKFGAVFNAVLARNG